MKTSNLFIAQQCDQAGEIAALEQCIASGQVSAAQIEAHRVAGEIHSCSLYCKQPVCIKAQRDEYRQKLIDAQPVQSSQALQTIARLLQVHEGRKPEDALKIAAGMIGAQPTPVSRAREVSKHPVALSRDDTEHGVYYYKASEVDASTVTNADIDAAREALSSLDDFALMPIGINAIGPRGVLERFIANVAAAKAQPVQPKEFLTDAQFKALCEKQHAESIAEWTQPVSQP